MNDVKTTDLSERGRLIIQSIRKVAAASPDEKVERCIYIDFVKDEGCCIVGRALLEHNLIDKEWALKKSDDDTASAITKNNDTTVEHMSRIDRNSPLYGITPKEHAWITTVQMAQDGRLPHEYLGTGKSFGTAVKIADKTHGRLHANED